MSIGDWFLQFDNIALQVQHGLANFCKYNANLAFHISKSQVEDPLARALGPVAIPG